MKKRYTLIPFLFITTFLFAQTESVITGISSTSRLFLDDTNLYCSYFGQIDVVDLSNESNLTSDLFQDGLSFPAGMARYFDDFYIAVFGQGKIIKFNINEIEPNYIDVTSSGETPNVLIVNNDYLYYSDNNEGSIYKFDLNGSSNEAQLLVSDYITVTGLAIKDNFLYFSVVWDGAIYKIDLFDTTATPTEVVSGMWHPLGIKLDGNDLYVADRNANIIYKIDISENPAQLEIVLTSDSVFSPRDVDIYGSYLYILEADRLSRIELSSLSVAENVHSNSITLYPNPTTSSVQFLNLEFSQSYSIYDLNGRTIIQGSINPNQKIDVSSLNSGCYLVKLENESKSFRFIKV